MKKQKFRTYHLVSAGNVFRVTLIVIGLTVCGVYFWGLGTHHTFFENGILSTTILSIAFFLFITFGLYRGIKLKNDVASLSENIGQIDFSSIPDVPSVRSVESIDVDLDIDEGCAGAIVAAILWFVVAILFAIFLWFFGQIMWLAFFLFSAMLYWIFFRALRLVFKNSNRSKGNLIESIRLGLFYTFLYNFWIYGIFLITANLKG